MHKCIETVNQEIKKKSGLIGIHIEGPFFSLKYRGVHQKKYISKLSSEYLELFSNLKEYPVILTLAPECISLKDLNHLASLGIKIMAGHTDASYDELEQAAKNNLNGFTHLFNAMSQMSAREPGAVGAALDFDNLYASIIVDLHHVHHSLIELAYQKKPIGKLFFISDSMATINHGEPTFELYDEIVSEQNGRITNAEGKLAGSSITQIDAVKNACQQCNIPLDHALSMASNTGKRGFGIPKGKALDALVAPAPVDPKERALKDLADRRIWASTDWHDDEHCLKIFEKYAERTNKSNEAKERQMRAMNSTGNREQTLMKIKTPTLVLHGSADTLVDPSGGQRTAEVIPEAKFVMIEGWGHDLPPGSWPKITNEIIKHVKNAENIS